MFLLLTILTFPLSTSSFTLLSSGRASSSALVRTDLEMRVEYCINKAVLSWRTKHGVECNTLDPAHPTPPRATSSQSLPSHPGVVVGLVLRGNIPFFVIWSWTHPHLIWTTSSRLSSKVCRALIQWSWKNKWEWERCCEYNRSWWHERCIKHPMCFSLSTRLFSFLVGTEWYPLSRDDSLTVCNKRLIVLRVTSVRVSVLVM